MFFHIAPWRRLSDAPPWKWEDWVAVALPQRLIDLEAALRDSFERTECRFHPTLKVWLVRLAEGRLDRVLKVTEAFAPPVQICNDCFAALKPCPFWVPISSMGKDLGEGTVAVPLQGAPVAQPKDPATAARLLAVQPETGTAGIEAAYQVALLKNVRPALWRGITEARDLLMENRGGSVRGN
jgi:hypothetical protein